MFEAFQTVQGLCRFHRVAFDIRIKLVQAPAGSHNGTSGSDTSQKMGYPMIGLVPDFGGRGFEMRLPVGVVVVLVRHEINIGIFLIDFFCHDDRAI